MFASSWLQELYRRWFGRSRPRTRVQRRRAQQRPSFRPRLEALEDRTLLSNPGTTGELVNAIIAANSSTTPTTIALAANTTFNFTAANNTTNGANALPVITANITIVGNGDTIERTGTTPFRLFDVAGGGSLTLENLTLTGGLAQGTGVAAEGGAVYSAGTLALSGVTVKTNIAQGSKGANAINSVANGGSGASAYGGGLYMAGGSVTLTNDTLSGNQALGGNGGNGKYPLGGNGGTGASAYGGALYEAGTTATLTNDTFSGNQATGGAGGTGALYHNPTFGTLGHAGGSAGAGAGGGLYLAGGSVTLTNDTLSGNQANGGLGGPGEHDFGFSPGFGGAAGAGSGGAVYETGTTVTLTNDTLSGNNATGGSGSIAGGSGGAGSGGGLDLEGGIATLTNDTLSGNRATGGNGGKGPIGNGFFGGIPGAGAGGAVYEAGTTATLTNDTLSGNNATGGNGGTGNSYSGFHGTSGGAGSGGGLYLVSGSTTYLANTLIAQNTVTGGVGSPGSPPGLAGTASDPDVSGVVTSSDHNLIGSGSGFSVITGKDDIINPSFVGLAALASNGGPTETMALLPGSAAIDAGDSSAANLPSTDQRGRPRTLNGAVDIGAYEAQGFVVTATSGNNQITQANTAFTAPLVVTVTANDGVDPVAGGQVTFTPPSSGPSATLSPTNPATIAANGTAGVNATANDVGGSYSVTAHTSGVAGSAVFSLSNTTSAATKLAFLTQPSTTTAGSSITPAVQVAIEDQSGNILGGDNTDQVTLQLAVGSPTGGVLNGTLTETVVDGVATFSNLSLDQAGTGYELVAGSGSLTGATSNAFNITPTSATQVSSTGGLITAILAANNAPGTATTIALASNTTFDFTAAYNTTNGANALPAITANITIVGNGDTIERTGTTPFRLFDVAGGGSLTLENLTLTGGLAQGTGVAAEGGAVYSSGNLTLSGATVSSNAAQGDKGSGGGIGTRNHLSGFPGGAGGAGSGGGLYVAGGSASLTNDTLSGNNATGGLGGHGGSGVFINNTSKANGGIGGIGGAGSGGGLYVAAGTVTLTNDTSSGNRAIGGMGGVGGYGGYHGHSEAEGGTGGVGSGGGLYVAGGTATLTNDTLSENRATGGHGGSFTVVLDSSNGGAASGGGLYLVSGSTTYLANTLIAQNIVTGGAVYESNGIPLGNAGTASDPDVSGVVTSSDHNLIGSGSGFSVITGNGDIINPAFVGLGLLANNGGPTETMALLPGSAAIDAGDSSAANLPGTDQRGYARIVGNAIDIGAVEYQYDLAISGSAPASVTPGQTLSYQVTVTNNGPDTAGEGGGVVLSDVLPSGVTFVSLTTTSSGWTTANNNGTVTATIPTLASGASATFTLTVQTSNSTPNALSNTVTIGPSTWDTLTSNNSISFNTTVQAAQAAPTVSVTDASGTYTGKQFAATGTAVGVGGITVSGTFSYAYYTGSSVSGTPSATAPTNAGTYTVVASFTSSNSNYTGGSAQTTFTISKANATVVVAPYTVTYDGKAHTATVTSITGVNGETGATVGTVDVSNTTHTAAGTYASDSWSFTGTANYNNIGSTTITDVINPAAPVDVSSDATIQSGGFIHNFALHGFVQTLTITANTDLSGPLALELIGLSGATLASATVNGVSVTIGTDPNTGNPYLDLTAAAASLQAGQSLSVVLYFKDPTFQRITYNTEVLQGLS